MSGFIRIHQLQQGAALNRRLVRELYYQLGRSLDAVRAESLGNDIFEHGHFQESAFEDFYFSYIAGSNFTVPPGNMLPPGTFQAIDSHDDDVEATLEWSAWIEIRNTSCKSIMAWPVVGSHVAWGLTCLRQPGPVSVYDPLLPLPGPNYDDKLSWGGGWGVGDHVALGGSGVVILPRGAHHQLGILLANIGGEFQVRQTSFQVTRRAA